MLQVVKYNRYLAEYQLLESKLRNRKMKLQRKLDLAKAQVARNVGTIDVVIYTASGDSFMNAMLVNIVFLFSFFLLSFTVVRFSSSSSSIIILLLYLFMKSLVSFLSLFHHLMSG